VTSVRADIITKRTYCRPKDDGSLESWGEVVDRVIDHQLGCGIELQVLLSYVRWTVGVMNSVN
jgi:hypothetical protein